MADIQLDLNDLQRRSVNQLGQYAVETLRNRKWITKSYTSTFPFTDEGSAKSSQQKLFRVINREFLKAIPFLDSTTAVEGERFTIKKPVVNSGNIKLYVSDVPSAALIRYVRKLDVLLLQRGLPYVLGIGDESFYQKWDVIKGQASSIELSYNGFRQQIAGNPYKLFTILDDIFKVFSTLAKYTSVVDNVENICFPIYKTNLTLVKEIERIELAKQASEEERKKALSSSKQKKKPILTPSVSSAPSTSTAIDSTYMMFNGTNTNANTIFTTAGTAGGYGGSRPFPTTPRNSPIADPTIITNRGPVGNRGPTPPRPRGF